MTDPAERKRAALSERIRALLSKTEDAGATAEEAAAAAAKAGELMAKHRLSMSDIEFAEEPVEIDTHWTGRRTHGAPVTRALGGVEVYCGVKIWLAKNANRGAGIQIFGMKSDVAMAKWLVAYIADAAERAASEYRKTDDYKRKAIDAADRRSMTRSFKIGFCESVSSRLRMMARERGPDLKTADGTALVPLRDAHVSSAYDAMPDWKKPRGVARMADAGYGVGAGIAAGQRVSLNRPIDATDDSRLIGTAP